MNSMVKFTYGGMVFENFSSAQEAAEMAAALRGMDQRTFKAVSTPKNEAKTEQKTKRVHKKKKTHSFWSKEEQDFIVQNINLPLSYIRKAPVLKRHSKSAISGRYYDIKNGKNLPTKSTAEIEGYKNKKEDKKFSKIKEVVANAVNITI